MRRSPRKTGTKVRNGKVLRKNRTELSRHYFQVRQLEPFIDRLRPGPGFRHFLSISDLKRFIGILPDWNELSVGLDAIILDAGQDAMGWHWDGVIAICAWDREMIQEWDTGFVESHHSILEKLGVETEVDKFDAERTWCYFDDASIKGFQLMHILLHELGHHHDRMTTKSKRYAARGEDFAERYAFDYADRIWDAYFQEFSW